MTETLATTHAPPAPNDDGGSTIEGQRHAVPRHEQIAMAATLIRSGRNVVISGSRQSGRTTCLRAIVAELGGQATIVSASETARAIPLGALAGVVRPHHYLPSMDRIGSAIDELRTARALIAVDDADLLDDESALVLLALTRHIPVLLTVHARAHVPDAVERLSRDHASTIELTPLDPNELLEIAEAAIGGLLDPGSLVRLSESGEGSPGHLLRTIAQARRDGTLHDRHGVWSYERRTLHSSGDGLQSGSPVRGGQTKRNLLGDGRDDGAAAGPPRAKTSRRLRLVVDPSLDSTNSAALRNADALLRRGEPDAAARLLAPLLAPPERTDEQCHGELVNGQLHWALAWAGRMPQGQHPITDSPAALLAHAYAAAELGDDAAATSAAAGLAASTEAPTGVQVDALHLLGRLEMTKTVLPRMAAIVASAADGSLPPVAFLQVTHLRALGRRDGRGLEDVSAQFRLIDYLAFAHEAITQAAMMHLHTGSPRHAGRCRAEAEALAATGLRPTFAARRAVGQLPLLTKRERAVVERIAGGQTLRQVASELGCAPRTAESHLQHAYVKLGVNDRTALRSIVAKRA